MRIKEIIEEDFTSVSDLENFQKSLGIKFRGLVKIWNLPFGPTPKDYDYGWSIISFLPKHKDKVLKIANNLTTDSGHYLYIYDPLEHKVINSSGTMYDHSLLDQMLHELGSQYKIWKEKNPDNMILSLFYGRNEVEHIGDSKNTYYHVSNINNLEEIGISPQSTIKYKDRVYFWGTLKNAEKYADWLNWHGTVKRVAYIYEIKYSGKMFKDFEYDVGQAKGDAFYSKESIPPENIKKLKTVEPPQIRYSL
jgi:hypothetical protein